MACCSPWNPFKPSQHCLKCIFCIIWQFQISCVYFSFQIQPHIFLRTKKHTLSISPLIFHKVVVPLCSQNSYLSDVCMYMCVCIHTRIIHKSMLYSNWSSFVFEVYLVCLLDGENKSLSLPVMVRVLLLGKLCSQCGSHQFLDTELIR